MTKKRKIDFDIKDVIRSNNSKNKKLIKNLMINLKELQNCTISISSLEILSKFSIKSIQRKRNLRLQTLRKLSMQINAFQKKTTLIEKKFMTKTYGGKWN